MIIFEKQYEQDCVKHGVKAHLKMKLNTAEKPEERKNNAKVKEVDLRIWNVSQL